MARSPVSERLCDAGRQCTTVTGEIFCDNSKYSALAGELSGKEYLICMVFVEGRFKKQYVGQAFFTLRDGVLKSHTVLHNVLSREGYPCISVEPLDISRQSVKFEVPKVASGTPVPVMFPDGVGWWWGFDHIYLPFHVEGGRLVNAFDVASRFPQPGDNIGIVTIRQGDFQDGDISDYHTLTQEKQVAIYGPPGVLTLLTGTIQQRENSAFTHDVNTYKGASGSAVIYLDGDDAGKVFGVHIGGGLGPHDSQDGARFNRGFVLPEVLTKTIIEIEEPQLKKCRIESQDAAHCSPERKKGLEELR